LASRPDTIRTIRDTHPNCLSSTRPRSFTDVLDDYPVPGRFITSSFPSSPGSTASIWQSSATTPPEPSRRRKLLASGRDHTHEREEITRYGIVRLEDIEELDDGRCPYRPVRHHFGITTFGATTWTAKNAGDRLLNEHDEKNEFDELYLVLSGTARFVLAGDTVQAQTGPLLDDGPPYPELLYNVACSESLLGRTDDALDHLRRAIQLMPEIARFARDDQDLAALRDEPGFAELTSD
jgi:hypothetical protein